MTKVQTDAPRNDDENLKCAYLRVTVEPVVLEVVMIAHPALKMDQRRMLGSTRDTRYRRRSKSALSQGATCDPESVPSCEAPVRILMLRR